MKKLFETLLVGIFTVIFSGSLFSNTFTKTSLTGANSDFRKPYEITENTKVNSVINPFENSNIHIAETAVNYNFSNLVYEIDASENHFDISLVNCNNYTIERSSSLSVEQETITSFNVFPNPATDKLFIKFNNWEGIKEIKLIDITGRSVYKIKSNEELNELDISTVPRGIYLIAAKNEFHYEVLKIKIQ